MTITPVEIAWIIYEKFDKTRISIDIFQNGKIDGDRRLLRIILSWQEVL